MAKSVSMERPTGSCVFPLSSQKQLPQVTLCGLKFEIGEYSQKLIFPLGRRDSCGSKAAWKTLMVPIFFSQQEGLVKEK